MSTKTLFIILAAITASFLAIMATAVKVNQGQALVLRRFGKVRHVLTQAGLHFRLPTDAAEMIDLRKRLHRVRHSALTQDGHALKVQVHVVWAIVDVRRYLERFRRPDQAEDAISAAVSTHLTAELKRLKFAQVVGDSTALSRIEKRIDSGLQAIKAPMGISVSRVGVEAASPDGDLRKRLAQSTKARWQAQAKTYPQQVEAELARIGQKTKHALGQVQGKQVRNVEEVRGRADAAVAEILAKANRQAPKLLQFLLSLQALERMLAKDDSVALSVTDPPFKVLLKAPGQVK